MRYNKYFITNLVDSNRSQSMANIPAQPITSPQHRPTYVESDMYRRQVPRKRDSSRRHTLGHGVDGSMVSYAETVLIAIFC